MAKTVKTACPLCGRELKPHCAHPGCDWFTCGTCAHTFTAHDLAVFERRAAPRQAVAVYVRQSTKRCEMPRPTGAQCGRAMVMRQVPDGYRFFGCPVCDMPGPS